MEEAIQQVQSKDTKEKLAGVERLQTILEHSRKALTSSEVASLVDATLLLLRDHNFRVCQGALQALSSAAALAGDHLKVYFNFLFPAVVERLGDSKQPVRDAGRRLLLALMEISSPTTIVERAGVHAWGHKNWRVREEFARTAASAINLFSTAEVPFQRLLLPPVLNLLEDSNSNVREAAMVCLEEMYRQGGNQFKDELQRHALRPAQIKDINARFEKIVPKLRSSEPTEVKNLNNFVRKSSPKSKPSETSSTGDIDAVDTPVDPVRVSSERELMKEIEKVASMLTPDQDWSVRIAAMQRVEGLVGGGAAEHACFASTLKQLAGPLCLQLSDRRSSIVKQACHLVNLLSRELLSDFECLAESFIPVLFKLVVITVLVIAESADNCIKTLLRNCRVSRVVPRIADCAKNDRSAILRARCCEYATLILERWGDSSEIQRTGDIYEDLIKCCVGDAMSEVRSMARSCYRLFSKTWPERSRRLFFTFDPAIQRLINDEEGGIGKRFPSPPVREKAHHVRNPPSAGGNATSQPDRSFTAASGAPDPLKKPEQERATGPPAITVPKKFSDKAPTAIPKKPFEQFSDRHLENVLQASQQQVNAIETMLKGLDMPDKSVVSATWKDPAGGSYRKIHAPLIASRVSVDAPSSRDPPHPASTLSTNHPTSLRPSVHMPSFRSSADASPHSFDLGRIGSIGINREAGGNVLNNVAKRVPMTTERSSQTVCVSSEPTENKGPKRVLKEDKSVQESSVPGFQRPLLKNSISGRSSVSSRSSMDEVQVSSHSEPYSCLDGLMTLNDALTEGLSMTSDWSARVAAFTYLRKLLQQGPKGLQEVHQNFEKIMKLFYEHLDDPHHKVAQAALSTLGELVPACRKAFETYLERLLPRVFARLIDAKEVIRQLGTSALETVGNIYSIDALLPALLRSLDEQRSPKAKMAVIEFAIAAFAKLALNGEAAGGSGMLKLWLAKLAPLANDKNPKLKETAVTGIISVYSHFDSATVLNFILGLSIEEQSILRRALKQYTPRIEVDLMTYLQNRNQRGRQKPTEQSEALTNLEAQTESLMNLESQAETMINLEIEQTNLPSRAFSSEDVVHIQPEQTGPSRLLHKFLNWGEEPLSGKREALQEIVHLSRSNDLTIWSQYSNQILLSTLESFGDSDPTLRELAVLVIPEMLSNQKGTIDASVELVLEKLVAATRDYSVKVSTVADRCLSALLSLCDPQRCLNVLVPLLISDDDRTLVTCISCLTKLVTRLPQDELMAQLPTFLPALFDAFGNQNADVRKTVVFCLVDIYIVLGKSFVPYLGSLSSTQLRLVTIYTNRISQARTGATLDSS